MILDRLMAGADGLEVLAQMQKEGCRVPTIVLSAVGHVSTVVKAMRLGAVDACSNV
jgi:FixJ family two-component response regulator